MKRTLSLFLTLIMLISWFPQRVFSETYAEFTANGGDLVAPEEAVAVDIPMRNNSDDNEIFILNREHRYENGIYTACGTGDLHTTDWMGASAVFLGDSITYGTGTDKTYHACIDEMGVFQSVQALGVAGSCISSQSDYGSGNSPFIHRYSSIPDADLIVVFMGTNDYGHETPLGSPLDATDVSFYGALNVIIPGIQAQHPDSQLVFVTPLHRYGFGSSKILGTQFTYDHIANGRGHTLSDYVDAIKVVCAKYSVPIIDLYNEYPVDPSDSADRAAYIPDGLHPNTIGHEMIADLICQNLQTIPNKNADDAAGEEDGADSQCVLLQHGNKFVSSYADDPTRASSITNLYLSKGQTVTFKLSGEYVWALAKTDSADSTHYSRYYPENGWNNATLYTVAENGYYGLVLKKCDESAFDFDNRDSSYVFDYIFVEDPDKHKHAYTAAVTAPTCTEQGYTTYTCACGDSYVADYVDALDHTYENGICTICGGEAPNPYAGKTIACIGDSITYGVGVTRDETDYVTLLAESLEMDYIRLGASGTTLCTDGSRACNIGKLTEGNLAGADVVTVLMGINDFCAAGTGYYELGEIDSTDTSTIYGAAHMWCQRIAELRQTDSLKDTEFWFMTPLITSWNNSVSSARNWDQSKTNIHGYTLRDLCNAILEVCALYDIPAIDLNLLSGLYYNSAENNTVTEFGGDGVHPGTVGHQMMAEAIENRLLQNHLRDDHDHSYGSWITTRYPDCVSGEQQRVCSVCTATERKKLAGNGHTYENGICTACGAEHPNLANFEGKVISILGDSISTFAGYIPVADGFNREHLPRYPQADLLTDVNETWWMQVIDGLDAKLGINDSWRGATCSGAHSVTTGTTGENAAMANLTRIQNLGSNGTPDVIFFYGGTNDLAHVSKVGTFDPETAPDTVDLVTQKWDNLADGYVNTILRLQYYYPDPQIVCLLPNQTTSYYTDAKLAQGNEVLSAICEHYGVAYTDLRECGISISDLPDGIHPNAAGMDHITQAVMDAVLTQCEVEAGENLVYSVRHELTDAVASLGHYKGISAGNRFEETLTGEGLTVTVTMDGVDITASCYTYGKISIEEVTGDLLITAQGKFLSDHLQPLPDRYWQINLWPALEHDDDYYTVTGWGVHSSGQVKSATIPVTPEHILVASSFRESGANSGSVNGIRVTFFTDSGVLISMSTDRVYAEFREKGYLQVPENAVAVCVPMWKEAGGELYVQPLSELTSGLQNYTYTLDPESSTVTLTKYIGTASDVTVLPRYMVDDQLYTTVLDSASVFRGNSSLTSVKVAEGVKFKDDSMAYLFSECKNLLSVDMTGVDTSCVTDMRYLFDWCSKLSSIAGYEDWDTGAVQNMYKMFNRTSALAKIDLSAWDLSQVINSGWCFRLCMASEILLPDSLKTMSAGFLNHATQYAGTTFTIPSGVEKIGYAHTIYDFATNDFVEFKVPEGNTNYVAIDGILYSADGTEMLAIPRNKAFAGGIYEIPEGVTFLGELSFSRNYNIETLVLPDSYVIEFVDVYDDRYVVWEDLGNLNVGTNLTIAIYCYTGIRDYVVKDTNPNYTSVDGIIYTKDMTAVVAVPTRYGRTINIPEGVTTWNQQAMWNDTEVADLYADHTVDNLLSACGGIHIPSTMVSIDEEQVNLINRLHHKYADRFEITVHESNPAYCVDENGYLQQHCYENGFCAGCGAVLGDLDLDGDVDAYDLTKHARFVGGIITDWSQE